MTEHNRRYIDSFAKIYGFTPEEVVEHGEQIADTFAYRRYVLVEELRNLVAEVKELWRRN